MTEARTDPLFERYMELFFSGKGLQTLITHLCNLNTCITDPITTVLLSVIKNPITLTVTHIGLVPIKDKYTLTLPFRYMTDEQRTFIRDALNEMKEANRGVVSTQMGGGCVISYICSQPQTFLNAVDVLSCFCRVVSRGSGSHSSQERKLICDIIVQRVSSGVGLCRRDIQIIGKCLQDSGTQGMAV